jgi:hypothetical protein
LGGIVDELNDVNDPATKAAADQLQAGAVDALRASKAFMLVTVDPDGEPRLRCTSTGSMSLGETARWAVCIAWAADKTVGLLNEGIALSQERHDDEEAA